MKPAQELTIHISSQAIIRVALFCSFFFSLYYMRDLLMVLLMSVVIASSVEPFVLLAKKYKIPRTLSVFFVFTVVISLFLSIIYLFIPIVAHEFKGFVSAIPAMIHTLTTFFNVDQESVGILKNIFGDMGGVSAQDVFSNVKGAASQIGGGIASTAGAFLATLTKIILITVISFYLSVQEKGIETFLRVLTPKHHEKYVIDLWGRSANKIAKWMQGQLVLGLIIGILVYLGLSVLGVPYALLLALLAGLFELIPVIGPILSMVPAVILAFSSGGASLALMVLFFYFIIQRFENDILYPLVVNKVTGVNPLVVIIALLIGAKLAGLWGVLLAVPVSAAIMEYINDVQKDKELL